MATSRTQQAFVHRQKDAIDCVTCLLPINAPSQVKMLNLYGVCDEERIKDIFLFNFVFPLEK